MLRVISLGAGVQSTTMALMAMTGELGLPLPDCAIFADTGSEKNGTYEHLRWLCGCTLTEIPTPKGIKLLPVAGEWKEGILSYPVHIANAWSVYGRPRIVKSLGDSLRELVDGPAKQGSHSRPPFFVKNLDGGRGILRRQCTGDFKIDVIQAKERHLLGLVKRQRWPKEIKIEQWIGISTDEATRIKPVMCRSRDGQLARPHPTIVGRWPLIDIGMSRMDCGKWLQEHGHAIPPKSSCTFCPYHDDSQWREIKADPVAWEEAVAVDEAIRHGFHRQLDGILYLHGSLQPLVNIDFDAPRQKDKQLNLFESECEGYCGN